MRRSGGRATLARIGVTGLSNIGYRATAAEKALEGTAGSAEDIAKGSGAGVEGADANSDLHASADYRKHLTAVYATRAITAASKASS